MMYSQFVSSTRLRSSHISKLAVVTQKSLAIAATTGIAGILAATPAHGLIATYDFNGNTPNATLGANTQAASPITGGVGTANNTSATFTATGDAGVYGNVAGGMNNTNQAINNNSFIEFAVTPQSGFRFDFTSLTLDAQISPVTGTTPGEGFAFLRANTGTGGAFTTIGGAAQTFNPSASLNFAFSLSRTTATTFRLYFYRNNGSSDSTRRNYTVDNIVLNGTATAIAPVPFPFAPLPGLIFTWMLGYARRLAQSAQARSQKQPIKA